MPSVDIDITLLSGRFNRAATLLDDQVDAVTRRPSTDIVVCTEVDRPARGAVLRDQPGFALLRDGSGAMGETAILHRTADWVRVASDALILDTELDGMRNAQVAPIELLQHRDTGITLLLTATHTPSGVEGAWQGRRAAEHRDSVEAWRRHTLAWRQRYRPDAVAAFADWNLDLHQQWIRDWICGAWPGLRPLTPRLIPDGGTHGDRLIDWALTLGIHDRQFELLKKHAASDHRGVRLTGTIHARKEHRR